MVLESGRHTCRSGWRCVAPTLTGRAALANQSIPSLDRLRESFCCRQVRERVGIR
jgi:hypothetical protein